MGSELYFYKIEKIKEKIPEIVEINVDNFPYSFVYETSATWEKKFGLKRKTRYETVNYFKAAEDKFGVRPTSMQYPSYIDIDSGFEKEYRFSKDDEFIGIVTDKELEKYKYTAESVVYLYKSKLISHAEWYSILNIKRKSGIVSAEYLRKLIKNAVKDIGDEPSDYESRAVIAALKAMLSAEDGNTVAMAME